MCPISIAPDVAPVKEPPDPPTDDAIQESFEARLTRQLAARLHTITADVVAGRMTMDAYEARLVGLWFVATEHGLRASVLRQLLTEATHADPHR